MALPFLLKLWPKRSAEYSFAYGVLYMHQREYTHDVCILEINLIEWRAAPAYTWLLLKIILFCLFTLHVYQVLIQISWMLYIKKKNVFTFKVKQGCAERIRSTLASCCFNFKTLFGQYYFSARVVRAPKIYLVAERCAACNVHPVHPLLAAPSDSER